MRDFAYEVLGAVPVAVAEHLAVAPDARERVEAEVSDIRIAMANTVKSQKFNILFDWFDQGRDGRLSHDDFQAMIGLFTRLVPEGDHANAAGIRNAFEEWWRLLLEHGDRDGDGHVSQQEFITVMEANVTAPEHFEHAVLALIDSLMKALDTNGNGLLSRDEYVRMYAALGIPPHHSGEAFTKLDRDGDGVISQEEFRMAITEFYLSADPNAPGNWLLGPIGAPT